MTKRLLVVEDDPHLLRAIAVCLRRAGYEIATARGGDEAVVRIAETIPDLIVSDIMMPGIDGFALAELIRANPRTDIIPIVFLTARDTRADRIAGFRAGVDAYLVKPFEPEELVAVIQGIVNRVQRTHARIARRSIAAPTGPGETIDAPTTIVAGLTEAETRVAHLVAQSLSNKEIATQLGISSRTVEMHISNILGKKGWGNRVEIARHVFGQNTTKRSNPTSDE